MVMCLLALLRSLCRAKKKPESTVSHTVTSGNESLGKDVAAVATPDLHAHFGGGGNNELLSPSSISSGPQKFKLAELSQWTDNFSKQRLLGVGGFGKVFEAHMPGGRKGAVKRAKRQSEQGNAQFLAEVELLSQVHHKNLVKLLGYCNEAGEKILVYEYMAKGTLRRNLSRKRERPLDWVERLNIAIGSAAGITYLHTHVHPPIIHRDIKSSNILLDDNYVAKVADFGLCRPATTEGSRATISVRGTVGYMDPDFCVSSEVSEKSDVYSFGVVLLEIVTAKSPTWKGQHIINEMKSCCANKRVCDLIDPTLTGKYPRQAMDEYIELALRCTDSSRRRPSMTIVWSTLEMIRDSALSTPSEEEMMDDAQSSGSVSGRASSRPMDGSSPFLMRWPSQATSVHRASSMGRRSSTISSGLSMEACSTGASPETKECAGETPLRKRERARMTLAVETDGVDDDGCEEPHSPTTLIQMLTEVSAR
ncbi:hypothetical protein CBR_g41499 [Chara braunii]|uniref:Protein kinase domain-containing protein n=1 Tax=Chara braunii TaxID=69332 RepID=A0A388LW21_CHABU|nr:hypothetical protein CBR_g41499 [Chara braunii]|eukprot:GBG86506.1 hypothetical protein CBR_g41499 [Chara braunii]